MVSCCCLSSCSCQLSSRCSHSSKSGVAISALAEGVAARTSATKSQIVKSTSWPTALTIGIEQLAMALAKASLLNAHRSSIEPPPRPIISKSNYYKTNYNSSNAAADRQSGNNSSKNNSNFQRQPNYSMPSVPCKSLAEATVLSPAMTIASSVAAQIFSRAIPSLPGWVRDVLKAPLSRPKKNDAPENNRAMKHT